MEKERREREERDRIEAEKRAEAERKEAERREFERKEHERREAERHEREERERQERERKEKEERERKLQTEQREREKLEHERKIKEENDQREAAEQRLREEKAKQHDLIDKPHKRRLSSPESNESITHEDKKPKSENSKHRRLSKDAKVDKHLIKHPKKEEKADNERRLSLDDRKKSSDPSSRSDRDKDKHRNKAKSRENQVLINYPKDKENSHENSIDKTFFDAIELRSSEEDERLRSIAKKEAKEKKEMERAKEFHDGGKTCSGDSGDSRTNDHDSKTKDKQDYERKSSRQGDDSFMGNYSSNRSRRGKSSRRNATGNSSDDSDSESGRKKHSIFDIPDDGPAYISMYDKVKARSCKNMQKQEEEKKIRAKFSKLKRSRAKRENKKRSTSWDEDSDSDDDEPRYNRVNHKGLDSSSDDEMRSSDDKFNHRRLHENMEGESSENSAPQHKPRRKISSRKNSRSTRIASSDSDDDVKVKQEVKLEMISDDDDYKSTPVKHEKHEIKTEIKKEPDSYKFSSQVCDISSDGDALKTPVSAPAFLDSKSTFENLFGAAHDSKKKHKKNKKRQKSLPFDSTDEDMVPLNERRDSLKTDFDELKRQESHERRSKHGSKKEKKREKNREEHEQRISKVERKKIKKQKACGKQNDKREEKMENIFGPLSDDETRHSMDHKSSMSCSSAFDQLLAKTEAENRKNEEIKEAAMAKEESKKKKDRRRRERNRRQEDENSVDLDEAGRALEAQLLMSDSEHAKHDQDNSTKTDDVFRFSDGEDEGKKEDSHRREKKKKRKRSKEEKTHKHHHHRQQSSTQESSQQDPSPSLPCLLDDSSTPSKNIPVRGNGMTSPPPSMDSKAITSSPVKKNERKNDIFIPGFGGKIDEKIHESAVQSIAQELETTKKDEKVVVETKPEVTEPVESPKGDAKAAEEKSRVVISQEETEDAVAALLGEYFIGFYFPFLRSEKYLCFVFFSYCR